MERRMWWHGKRETTNTKGLLKNHMGADYSRNFLTLIIFKIYREHNAPISHHLLPAPGMDASCWANGKRGPMDIAP